MSSFMEHYFGTAGNAKSNLLESMRKHGVAYLEARFSGGNDEGGVDEVSVMRDAAGNDVELPNMGWEHELQEACDAMLSTEFGTWAGDFSAYGTLTADLKTGKVSRAGQVSGYTDDSNDY